MATAFVTGASRGIGKAIAVHLARAGYDVALTARTVQEGEQREHSSTVARSDTSPLPGSLSTTAQLVEDAGVRCLTVPADLTDRPTVVAAAKTVLAEWGPVDVLVNNGRYIGPGHMDQFLDTPLEYLDLHMEANGMAPLVLARELLPAMLEQGSGTIINISSGAGTKDPAKPAGKGGWSMGYGWSKGAMQRIVGVLNTELGDRGIRAYNVQPGFVSTERMAQDMKAFNFDPSKGAPPDVIGVVVAWMLANPDEAEALVAGVVGREIEAQDVCRDLGLLPGWPT